MQHSQADPQIASLQSENATLQHQLKQSRQVCLILIAANHETVVMPVNHLPSVVPETSDSNANVGLAARLIPA